MSWFVMGGMWMWILLAADLVQLPVTCLVLLFAVATRWMGGFLWPARACALLMLLAVAVPPVLGLVGWWSGCAMVEEAVRNADPSLANILRIQGYSEARIPLWFGFLSGAAMFVPAALAFGIAALPRRAPAEASDG